MIKDTEAREKVARLIAAGNHGDPWWWKQAFDDGSDETAVRLRADDVSVADTILAALATPATNELGFDPTAEVGDEVFPHDTIGSHFGNGGGLGPAAGEVAPVGDYHVTSAQYEAAVKGRQDFRQAYREQLNLLSQKEWAAVAQIGADQELSTSAVLRQAVRLYQMHLYRLKAGETLSWSGDEQRAKDFAGPLYAHPPHPAPVDPAGGEALREALKDMARGVFIDAATQTHHSWVDGTNGREPDFDEAAGDYAEGFADAYADNILAALKGPAA
jgi:hypothetical protein